MGKVIAVDGPAGAGKTSLVEAVGKLVNINVVNTGKYYRSIAVWLKRHRLSAVDAKNNLTNINLGVGWLSPDKQIMKLNGTIIDDKELNTEEISKMASDLSAQREVREWLLDKQRSASELGNIILEGRDIGTVVFPNADLKIYLTANPLIRAYRRYKQLKDRGIDADPIKVFNDLVERDYNDEHREYAPLRKAEDAILIDSTELNQSYLINKVASLCQWTIGV